MNVCVVLCSSGACSSSTTYSLHLHLGISCWTMSLLRLTFVFVRRRFLVSSIVTLGGYVFKTEGDIRYQILI